MSQAPHTAAQPAHVDVPAHSLLSIAVVGAGPLGLALALQAARALPQARVAVFDARPPELDISRDPRTLALSLGSVQAFERLGVWPAIAAHTTAIRSVHVSQQQPALLPGRLLRDEPQVFIDAKDLGTLTLGAVVSYGALVAPLQAAWMAEVAREPQRLSARFGTPVAAVKPISDGVEVDAGIAERYDLAVVAEGGVFSEQARKALAHDYRQTAWVGQIELERSLDGVAYERFTQHGPAALLPLPAREGPPRAALVWCVSADDDPVAELNDAQRITVLASIFPQRVGRITGISPLKCFPLGLNAERTLVEGRSVRIGNAAQTLHPVAGQGLNLGLRDAHSLVAALRGLRGGSIDAALRRVEWQRAPDRWALIAATDFLARSFTWNLPGFATLRGLGLAALQALPPARRALARQMMFGNR